jgi:dGTPase
VARALALNEDLTEAIGLGHDLGHAPFGHIGEAVLDRCLRERFGRGFRHFEHSLRVVDRLEGDGAGLNLCDDVRDGILCHSGRAPMPRTLEGRIVRIVDRVAYLNHDIDDALRAGVLREEDLRRGRSPCSAPRARADRHARARHGRGVAGRRGHRPGPEAGGAMDELRTFMFDRVYLAPRARREQAKVEGVISTLFDHYRQAPDGPPDGGGAPDADLPQRVTDYIAGMTDRYCIRAWEELALPDAVAL